MSTYDGIRELLPGYVLGVLDDDERRSVDEALTATAGSAQGSRLDAELLALTAQMEALADELEPVTPSELVRARLLRQIGDGEAASPERPAPREWLPWAAAAALFLVAATLGWQNFTLRGVMADLATGRDRVEVELAALRAELEKARTETVRLAAAQRIVAAPGTSRVLLAGLEGAPEASASTYVDADAGRAVFYAEDLPRLAADRTYQLWFIADGTPVSAGTFDVDERGEASVLVDGVASADRIAAWAVTIEPAGGVPQPTGAMVLEG